MASSICVLASFDMSTSICQALLPDTEEELFPHLHSDGNDNPDAGTNEGAYAAYVTGNAEDAETREGQLSEAYDDIPVSIEDPLSATGALPEAPSFPSGPAGLTELLAMLPTAGNDAWAGAEVGAGVSEAWGGAGAEAGDGAAAGAEVGAGVGAKLEVGVGRGELRDTVGRRMGFTVLTPIQRHAVPLAFANRDLICSAATGSGKTAAYLIPAIAAMLTEPTGIVSAVEADEAVEGVEDVGPGTHCSPCHRMPLNSRH